METTYIPRLFVMMIQPAPANLNAGTGDFAFSHKYHRRMGRRGKGRHADRGGQRNGKIK
jgi:hypothetical protein